MGIRISSDLSFPHQAGRSWHLIGRQVAKVSQGLFPQPFWIRTISGRTATKIAVVWKYATTELEEAVTSPLVAFQPLVNHHVEQQQAKKIKEVFNRDGPNAQPNDVPGIVTYNRKRRENAIHHQFGD